MLTVMFPGLIDGREKIRNCVTSRLSVRWNCSIWRLPIPAGKVAGRNSRARELLCDAISGGKEYGSDFASLDRYFSLFAVAARAGR